MREVKIQEIVNETGFHSSELLDNAKELGFDVETIASTISTGDAKTLINYISLQNNIRKSCIKFATKTNKKTKNRSTKKPIKHLEDSQLSDTLKGIKASLNKNYTPSEKIAIKKGFTEVADPSAYNGRYFVKNKKVWIHNIYALKTRLGVTTDQEVRTLGYDVDSYYEANTRVKYEKHNRPVRICDTKDGNGSRNYNLGNMVYMCDGMYIHEDDCWW